MMDDANKVDQRMREAIKTGEIIGICYQGGSQPGAYREIAPLEVVGQQVKAWCQATGITKTFDLDLIELRTAPPSEHEGIAVWTAPALPTSALATIAEVEAIHRASLEALGWHVAVERTGDGEFLTLHRKTKAGKPLKSFAYSLAFEPMTWDASRTREGEPIRTNVRPRARPWSTAGKTWGDASKAIDAFLKVAIVGP